MLLKNNKENYPKKCFEPKKKKPGLSANQAFEQFEQLRRVEHLLHVLYIYTPDVLWPVSPQITSTWDEPHDITSLQNFFIIWYTV